MILGGTVPAGESARAEAARAAREAAELQRQLELKQRRAENFESGAAGETRTAQLLGALTPYGFHVLHDRRWPGSANANIDHLVVGPSGVFVIDTKSWSGDLTVEGGRLLQGQDPRDDAVDAVQSLADRVRDGVSGLGLPPVGVRAVLAFDARDLPCVDVRGVWVAGAELLPRALLSHAKNLTQMQVELVLRGLMDLFPPAIALEVATREREPSPTELPEDVLFSVSDLADDALKAAMKLPLEDWMVFLHPRQADFARRRFNGPALLRGSAGTGKTVVALHRLAYLAERRAASLLFLSFVRTLPAVQRAAYQRLSPNTVDRVQFASLHGWASQLLASRGQRVSVRPGECEGAYRDAWTAVGAGSVLDQPNTWTYWSEEVRQVIRGRCIGSLGEYQALARSGRGNRLGPVQRERVWELKEAYESNLRKRGLIDWEDLLRAALASLQASPLPVPYDAVVVDEVQDLTLTGVQLAAHVAADAPDSLLLVGDSRQAVFAGGVSPSQAGVGVTGRSSVLTVNYRNTAEILEFAAPLVADDEDVLGDGDWLDVECDVERHGLRPIVARGSCGRDIETKLLHRLRRTQAEGRASWGSMAVLCERLRDVARYRDLLIADGIPVVALEQWSGERVDAVKLGTIKRAKGLEFLFVFLPEVDIGLLPGAVLPSDEVDYERLVRGRRGLYVAATRARDGLWIGLLGPHQSQQPDVRPRADAAKPSVPRQASVPGSVYALAERELHASVIGGPARFNDGGWEYQGLLAIVCEVCSSPLYALRKPYEVAGKPYRYWALICRHCGTAREPQSLPDPIRKAFRKVAKKDSLRAEA